MLMKFGIALAAILVLITPSVLAGVLPDEVGVNAGYHCNKFKYSISQKTHMTVTCDMLCDGALSAAAFWTGAGTFTGVDPGCPGNLIYAPGTDSCFFPGPTAVCWEQNDLVQAYATCRGDTIGLNVFWAFLACASTVPGDLSPPSFAAPDQVGYTFAEVATHQTLPAEAVICHEDYCWNLPQNGVVAILDGDLLTSFRCHDGLCVRG
jgi:hypothetical protein